MCSSARLNDGSSKLGDWRNEPEFNRRENETQRPLLSRAGEQRRPRRRLSLSFQKGETDPSFLISFSLMCTMIPFCLLQARVGRGRSGDRTSARAAATNASSRAPPRPQRHYGPWSCFSLAKFWADRFERRPRLAFRNRHLVRDFDLAELSFESFFERGEFGPWTVVTTFGKLFLRFKSLIYALWITHVVTKIRSV